ncbi:FHA domain-containing protein [Archangium primigenium]|uniref:FHA domain-containing protein n=1 Tax=[Archangium] primigenium TaxID=2792470 RepID=UPI00195E100A|nr:FHA domain-containing protein [Archangium primigenium]MBM7117507.1 FHA domain-containing protein [Archangium primigenium]
MSQLLLSVLAVVCPTCDGHNPARAEACTTCGTALQASARTAARPSARPGAGPAPGPPGMKPSSRTPPPMAAAGGVPVARPPPGARPPVSAPPVPGPPVSTPAARPPAAPPPPPGVARPAARPPAAASRFGLMVVSGSARGQRFKLPVTGCTVGRSRGAILFADDVYVSALHASFLIRDNVLLVRDEASASGLYVTISGAEALTPYAFFSVGQRLFRFLGKLDAPPPLAGRPIVYGAPVPPGQGVYGVEEVLVGGRSGRAVVTSAPLLTIGQANCDFCYAQEEGLAGRHCELSFTPTGAQLRDLSGGLGTYVRIPSGVEKALRPGDRVRMGQHVVQVELMA